MINGTNSFVTDAYFYMCLPDNSHWCSSGTSSWQSTECVHNINIYMYLGDINPQQKTVHSITDTCFSNL